MKKNMGAVDRVIRTLIALALGGLYLAGVIGGVLGIVLLVVGVVFLVTSATGRCPGYVPLKLSTRKGPPVASGR